MKKLLLLTLIAPLAASPAAHANDPLANLKFSESPFESCKDVALLSHSDYQKNKAYWDQTMAECAELPVQVLPDTGFFSTIVERLGEADENQRSYEFLKRVGERSLAHVTENNKLTEVLGACARDDKAWFTAQAAKAPAEAKTIYNYEKCGGLLASVKSVVKDVGPKVRVKNAVMKQTASVIGSVGNAIKSVTTALPFEKVPLSDAEKAEVAKILAEDNKKVEEEFAKKVKEQEANVARLKALPINKNQTRIDQLMDDKNGRLVNAQIPTWYKEWSRESSNGANPNSPQARLQRDKEMLSMRNEAYTKHTEDFQKALQSAPVIAYLGPKKAKVKVAEYDAMGNATGGQVEVDGAAVHGEFDNADIASAAAELLKNGHEQWKEIGKTLVKGEKAKNQKVTTASYDAMGNATGGEETMDGSAANAAKGMVDLLKNGAVVREILAEDRSFCRTATGLANFVANQDLKKTGLIVAGMLAGGVGAAVYGPAALAAVGVAGASSTVLATAAALPAAGALYYKDFKEYGDAKARVFNVAHTVEGKEGAGRTLAEVKDFEEARDAVILSLAASPADLMGLGIGKGAVVAAGYLGGKIGAKKGASRAITASLRKKGMSDIEIAQVLKNVDSDDAAVSGQAAMKIFKELEGDPRELKLARELTRTRILADQNVGAFDNVQERLRKLPAAERAQVFDRVEETLKNVNTAKINAANRTQALEAVVSGAQLGADPKRLAAIVGDWDSGLDGLAVAFDAARKHMNKPEIRGLASADDRLTAALRKGLDDLKAGNPDLKAMPEKEWVPMRDQMIRCPVGGGKL